MRSKKLFHRQTILVELSMITMLIAASPSQSMRAAEAHDSTAEIAATKPVFNMARDPASPSDKSKSIAPLPLPGKTSSDKITSFFVRVNDSKRIQLSMLVSYQQEFTHAVRQLLGEKVTPLLFSVSTLPNRQENFDPALLRFEQRGRVWRPNQIRQALDIWPVEAGGPFGGAVTDSQVHQGVILLPEWFEVETPITVRYGDFHYLARFAN